jgi:hypothetical protein
MGATVLSYLPVFSQPNKKDVINACSLLEYGTEDIDQASAQDTRETMERVRGFYNNYANVLGALGGLFIAFAVEWLQIQFPDIKQIKFAHIGAGVSALWLINVMMAEYDRRINELRNKERLIVLHVEELNII